MIDPPARCTWPGWQRAGRKIELIIRDASDKPIFWQLVGPGNANYGVLEHVDNMPGRVVDNANFFALDDIDSISDSELYDRLHSRARIDRLPVPGPLATNCQRSARAPPRSQVWGFVPNFGYPGQRLRSPVPG